MHLIWQYTAVTKDSFQTLYIDPIERYATLVQQFPASESHHHSYLGGLLDHGLELITHALKMRRSYLYHLEHQQKIRQYKAMLGLRPLPMQGYYMI